MTWPPMDPSAEWNNLARNLHGLPCTELHIPDHWFRERFGTEGSDAQHEYVFEEE